MYKRQISNYKRQTLLLFYRPLNRCFKSSQFIESVILRFSTNQPAITISQNKVTLTQVCLITIGLITHRQSESSTLPRIYINPEPTQPILERELTGLKRPPRIISTTSRLMSKQRALRHARDFPPFSCKRDNLHSEIS